MPDPAPHPDDALTELLMRAYPTTPDRLAALDRQRDALLEADPLSVITGGTP